ncbi:MAG: hypothetical protein ACFFBD_10395 [Candidatus Hodarchaeota archaeon]
MAKKRPPKEALEELLFTRMYSVTQITAYFGVSFQAVYGWLSYYELPSPRKIRAQILKKKAIISYLRFNPINEIAKQQRSVHHTIQSLLNDANLEINHNNSLWNIKRRMKNSFIPISSQLAQVIDGTLLGDGSVSCNHKKGVLITDLPTDSEYMKAMDNLYLLSKATTESTDLAIAVQEFKKSRKVLLYPQLSFFQMSKAILETLWINHLIKLFQMNGYACGIGTCDFKNGRTGKITKGIHFWTQCTLQLEKERQRWYQDIKRVPYNLIITPGILLLWFTDDGSCLENDIRLHTQGFLESDVKHLCNRLLQSTGLHFTHLQVGKKFPDHYYLVLPIRHKKQFFAYLRSDPKIRDSLSLAKLCFPWKFDNNLQKKYIINYNKKYVDENYFQRYLRLLKQSVGKKNSLILARQIFPWKFE